ncbi:MAG: hypothetical protein ACFFG0_10215, partial [Candidatus Thorarchaeota archaeon]
MQEQSLIRFGGTEDIQDSTSFTVIYRFDFNFGVGKNYVKITLGPSLEGNLNQTSIVFDLKEGFLPESADSRS